MIVVPAGVNVAIPTCARASMRKFRASTMQGN